MHHQDQALLEPTSHRLPRGITTRANRTNKTQIKQKTENGEQSDINHKRSRGQPLQLCPISQIRPAVAAKPFESSSFPDAKPEDGGGSLPGASTSVGMPLERRKGLATPPAIGAPLTWDRPRSAAPPPVPPTRTTPRPAEPSSHCLEHDFLGSIRGGAGGAVACRGPSVQYNPERDSQEESQTRRSSLVMRRRRRLDTEVRWLRRL